MDRKPIGNFIHKQEFNYTFSRVENDHNKTPYYKEIKWRSSYSFIIYIVCVVLAISIVHVGNSYFSIKAEDAVYLQEETMSYEKMEAKNAYIHLTKSAKILTEKGKFNEAYKELQLAENLFPKEIFHQVYLSNLYFEICHTQGRYCDSSELYRMGIENKYSGHSFLKHLKNCNHSCITIHG